MNWISGRFVSAGLALIILGGFHHFDLMLGSFGWAGFFLMLFLGVFTESLHRAGSLKELAASVFSSKLDWFKDVLKSELFKLFYLSLVSETIESMLQMKLPTLSGLMYALGASFLLEAILTSLRNKSSFIIKLKELIRNLKK